MNHDDENVTRELPSFRNRLRDEQGRWEWGASIDRSTEKMNQRIQAIHCRLLERATNGRLTWDGDRIVRNPLHHKSPIDGFDPLPTARPRSRLPAVTVGQSA